MKKQNSVSSVLWHVLKTHQHSETLTYGELINALGEQAFGLITILFALPSALPISVIPGFSFIFGLPIVFIAVHLIIGRRSLWLPKKLANYRVNLKKLDAVAKKTLPTIMVIERYLKPRLLFLSSSIMERVLGVVLLILSLLLLLPIPFSNFFFASLIICFGLGLVEKDGLLMLIGYIGSFIYGFFLAELGMGVWHYLGS